MTVQQGGDTIGRFPMSVLHAETFMAALGLIGFIVASFFVLLAKRPEDACIAFVLGAVMFLPVGAFLKFPSVPPLDKNTLPCLCLVFPLLLRRGRRIFRLKPGRGVEALIFVAMIGSVITFTQNRDVLTYGTWGVKTVLPGLNLNDGLAMSGLDLVMIGLPFFVGRVIMRGPREGRRLLSSFALAGLVYALFILIEVRLSPQMHTWIYGYAPRQDFDQSIRWGGYRPVVFMEHGLATALFVCNTALAAFTFVKARQRVRGLPAMPIAIFLFLLLIICKSTGAIIYGFAMVPLLLWTAPRTQLKVCTILTVIIIAYPSLRASNMFPVKTALSLAGSISQERADSLEFRFNNEDALSAKARERMWFGWGSYNRNAIYDEEGKSSSVTDGQWIIIFGTRGVVGSIAHFGLLVLPIFIAGRRLRRIPDRRDQVFVGGLTMMLTISVLDLIPNGLFSNYPYFLAGALLGLVRALSSGEATRGEDSSYVGESSYSGVSSSPDYIPG
jgi:hypothetical protein